MKPPRWLNYALKEAERQFQHVAYGFEAPAHRIPCGACAYWDDEATDRESTGSCRADGHGTETREDETPSWCPGAKLMELRTAPVKR